MPGVKNWRWSNSYYRLFDRLTGKWQLNDPAPDYLVKYKLDGTDSSLTRVGGDDFRIGKSCPDAIASQFDGSTQWFTGNDNAILSVTGAFALSYWFFTDDKTNSNDTIFFGSSVGAGGDGFKISKTSGGTFYIRSNAVSVANVVASTFADGNWHHVVVNYDGVNVSSYVDGVAELADTAFSPTAITNNGVSIAQDRGTGAYAGGIDDVRLYNRVLSTNEITALYNYTCEWNPSLLSGQTWYDAQDQTTITEAAGEVSQWDDKGASSINLTQGTGANQPTTAVSTINGLNTLDFDTDDYLSNTTISESFSNAQLIVVAVLNSDATRAFQHLVRLENSATSDLFMIRENEATTSLQGTVNSGSGNVFTNSPSSLVYGTPFIGRQKYDSVNAQTFFNGTGGSMNSASGAIDIDEIFVSYTANQMNGYIGEIIFIPSSDETLGKKIEGYLAWKWGLVSDLPAGHPYKSTPPKI